MTFDEVLDQVRDLLQQRGRVTYRSLKRRFALDDEYLEDLKGELIKAEGVAADEDGEVLVWTGGREGEKAKGGKGEKEVVSAQLSIVSPQPLAPQPAAGERRQLTVMFIDLVGSTTLSQQLDLEDYHARVVAYQAACQRIIARYEGHIAQYLGDGVLVYFGYPVAHEEDAVRAVRSGLEIITAVSQLAYAPPLQVRIGIHTGPVVVGEIGTGERTERLALGETPNIAARLQGLAESDTVVLSSATRRLIVGLFECLDLGPQLLKGISTPLSLYRVIGESTAQNRFEVAVRTGLTSLVGRESELGLLRQRWEHAKAGNGQVVLMSGEPGIGKSRLVQELKEQLAHEGATHIEFRCSPYHQNSALYPIIDHLQRLLQFARDDTPAEKLRKLENRLKSRGGLQTRPYRALQEEAPLFAVLLSLPHPEGYPPITVSPQKQKERTQAALVAWLVEEAEKAAVYCAWEDLHWADPSTLEVLTLFLDQVPTTRLLVLLTFRPEFTPPWGNRSHFSQLTPSRLRRQQVEEMVEQVVAQSLRPLRLASPVPAALAQAGQALTSSGQKESGLNEETPPVRAEPVEARTVLPSEVIKQIVNKTDGVPLFVEELTKSVVEATRGQGTGNGEQAGEAVGVQHAVPTFKLSIPATLQDALMARLDRLGLAKEVAQLGATIGREFSYEILQAVSRFDEEMLQQGLKQLVAAELVYQRGLVPQAHYLFKHALIQDTAYQSLLKSTRYQYHQQIAQILEERFIDTKETQPELLAHHYTEAGLREQAIPYWQKAGERASQRSAYVEALSHLTKGLEVLKALPDTPEYVQQELILQITLSDVLITVKGETSPDVEKTVLRARELCQQLGETPQIFPVLWRLVIFYINQRKLQTTYQLAEQMMRLAQSVQDPEFLWIAHFALGAPSLWLGELVSARRHLEQAIALSDDPQTRLRLTIGTADSRVNCLFYTAWTLWHLGYPDQALKRSQEAIALAEGLSHPYSLAVALGFAALFHLFRRDVQLARERAEAVMTLSTDQGFSLYLMYGMTIRGWALTEQGQMEEGIAQMHQSEGSILCPYELAEVYGKVGQVEKGLTVLTETQAFIDRTGWRVKEAELYRLRGELTLQQESQKSKIKTQKSKVPHPKSQIPNPQSEAEACFLKAIDIARRQQAKSLELRAVMSLVRLRQQQAAHSASRTTHHVTRTRLTEAHKMLSDVYNWFTEGFDTKDLQEAKALLEELSH